jgi:hypothetical protein
MTHYAVARYSNITHAKNQQRTPSSAELIALSKISLVLVYLAT